MEPSGEDTSMQASENTLHGTHVDDIGGFEARKAIPGEDEGSGVTDPTGVEVINQDPIKSSGARAGPAPDHPLREPPSSATNDESRSVGGIGAHHTESGESQNRIGATERRGDDRGSSLTEPRRPDVTGTGAQHQNKEQQQQQQQRSVSAASTRSMVPDNEDDEENGHGRAASPRQYNLQNYASRDSGATMLESSPGSKGMGNLLDDDKDRYAISPCEDRQWAVLGLSEDILVRTIKISSHEKYSSLVKNFQVLASPTYPVNEWLDMGTFTAKSIHGEQTFELAEPAFARYLKFKFLSHYGDEFYCTLSQVKVHGSTMLESFQHDWQQNSAEVKEVQDMMKKDSKVAIGASSSNLNSSRSINGSSSNGTSGEFASHGNGGGSPHANDDAKIPPTSGESPQSRAAPLNPGTAVPPNDGGAEHRPHAASAAAVPVNGKRPGVNSGSGGDTGEKATVEEIVRGVPAEMVVPASTATCVGPTGTEGSCLEGVLADDGVVSATVGLRGEGEGGSILLGAGMPTIGAGVGGGKIGGIQNGVAATDRVTMEDAKTSDTVGTRGTNAEPASGQQEARDHIASEEAIADEGKKQWIGVGEVDSNGTDDRRGTARGRGEKEAQAEGVEPSPPGEGIAVPGNVNRRKQSTAGVEFSADAENGTSFSSSPSAAVATGRVERDAGRSVESDMYNKGKGASSRIAVEDGGRSSSEVETEPHEERTGGGCVGGAGESPAARSCGSIGRDQESTPSKIDVDVEIETPPRTETRTIYASQGEALAGEGSKRVDSAASTAGAKTGTAEIIASSSSEATDIDARIAATEARMGSQTISSSQPRTVPQAEPSVSESSAAENEEVGEPLIRVEGMDAAAAAAACLERLSFSDFREEVLARTHQAQHSASGGGVAIGGQYESIFKTLMNKIKTLEINQSLFGLYIDDVHACYQDVIAQIIKEQERTRASQSAVLNAQAAHIVRLSDQWPAFQKLQAKVVEVENRMLLGSMAWFTSLLCLAILLCTCCVNICRRPTVVGSGRCCNDCCGGRGRRRAGGNVERRYHHRDWSPASTEFRDAPKDSVTVTLFANEPDSPAKKVGWDKNESVKESTSTSTPSLGGRSGVASSQGSLSGCGSTEWVRSAGVARSTSPGAGRCSSCGEIAVGVAGDMSDARLEKRRW